MVSMTIRHVSDDDRDRIAEKAARAGQSLQEFMLALLHDTASREEPWEVLARHRARLVAQGGGTSLSADELVDLVHAARDER